MTPENRQTGLEGVSLRAAGRAWHTVWLEEVVFQHCDHVAKQSDCRAKEAQARLHFSASHLCIHRLVIVTESLPRALPCQAVGKQWDPMQTSPP